MKHQASRSLTRKYEVSVASSVMAKKTVDTPQRRIITPAVETPISAIYRLKRPIKPQRTPAARIEMVCFFI